MSKFYKIYPLQHGLGSRLILLTSLMCRKDFHNLKIIWSTDYIGCYCKFTDIFQDNFANITSDRSFITQSKWMTICKNDEWVNNMNYSLIDKHAQFKKLIPVSDIMYNVDKYKSLINTNTYGVHVRIGSHKNTNISGFISPISLFVSKIQNMIDIEKSVKFVVISDSYHASLELYYLFPNNVIWLNRSSLELDCGMTSAGCIRALEDLYLLSYTKEIICSRRSTFAEAASILGNIRQNNIYCEKRFSFLNKNKNKIVPNVQWLD